MEIRAAQPREIDELVAIDDDACALYEEVGLMVSLGADHPFSLAERKRWLLSAQEGSALLAVDSSRLVGLLVLGRAGEVRYLDQLSVRMSAQRQGVGRRLATYAIEWAAGEPLWLTTYAHLPWNRDFYEQLGFSAIPESQCPSVIVEHLEEERRWLPAPEQRIAMSSRRDPARQGSSSS
jgi:GNAT superfamily N-acetyltransferase